MNERLGTLIERLHAKTARREIRWKKSELDDGDAFEVSFPNYTVQVVARPAKDLPKVTLTIYNEEGNMLEYVTDSDLKEGDLSTGYDDTHSKLLRDTHRLARRIALGTDEAIDELISVLAD